MHIHKTKKLFQLAILSFVLLNCTGASLASTEPCNSVDKCIERIYQLSKNHSLDSLSAEERALVDQMVALDIGTSELVDLLASPNVNVADIASAVLRDTKKIDKKHLPKIIAGLDRKLGWLAPALAHIDSPDAVEEVVSRFLVSDSAPQNQEGYAVTLLGKKAIPFIIEAAACNKPCSEKDHYLLGYALREMSAEDRAEAARSLMKTAQNAEMTDVASGVLMMIRGLGKPGLIIEKELLDFRKKRLDLKSDIDLALVGIKSSYGSEYFIDGLADEPSNYLLRDLAEMGSAGKDAGPTVEKLLMSSDWELRLAAATTLGFIQYKQAAPKLIGLLNEVVDMRLNWAAAKALGRMKAGSARAALQQVHQKHWNPAVRKAALEALDDLDKPADVLKEYSNNQFYFEFFGYESMGLVACEETVLKPVIEPDSTKLLISQSQKKLKALSYTSEVISYGASDEKEQKAKGNRIIEVNAGNISEYRQPIHQVPNVALRVKDGWLAGSDRGEWGGELVFIKDGDKAIKVLDQNIEDIYLFGDKYVTVTGIAHLSSNRGMIFELSHDESDQWVAKKWRSLPDAPQSSWIIESGELLINTYGGGTILLSKDGSSRMASCVENKPN